MLWKDSNLNLYINILNQVLIIKTSYRCSSHGYGHWSSPICVSDELSSEEMIHNMSFSKAWHMGFIIVILMSLKLFQWLLYVMLPFLFLHYDVGWYVSKTL